MSKKIYHGWIIIEEPGPGLNPSVHVEQGTGPERKKYFMHSRGNSGCAEAIEWWDNKVGSSIKLEATIKGCYRVFTEEASNG